MKMHRISSLKVTEMIPVKMNLSVSSTHVTSSEFSRDDEEFLMMYDQKTLLQLENFDDDLNDIIRKPNTIANHSPNDKDRDESKPADALHVSSMDRNDLQRISLLGSGRFCNVYSVTGIISQPSECKNQDHESPRKRSLLAFKSINPSRVRNSDELVVAAIDLANEAKILSQLDHKNIIKLRGISKEQFSKSFLSDDESRGDGFFLVLDMLKDTLAQRLHYWRKNYRKIDSTMHPSNKRRSSLKSSSLRKSWRSRHTDDHQSNMMYQRIEKIAVGIAEGMEYIHSNQIVLRDLKPSNIGFDYETGTEIRLFDFGMARRVTECLSNEICGSARYMAPEVMCGEGYSLKVDSFSFGVLLFEICSLRSPYEDNYWNQKRKQYKRNSRSKIMDFGTKPNQGDNKLCMFEEFYSCVLEDQLLPSDDLNSTILCPKIRELISECWSRDPDDRPTFTEILSKLNVIFDRQA